MTAALATSGGVFTPLPSVWIIADFLVGRRNFLSHAFQHLREHLSLEEIFKLVAEEVKSRDVSLRRVTSEEWDGYYDLPPGKTGIYAVLSCSGWADRYVIITLDGILEGIMAP